VPSRTVRRANWRRPAHSFLVAVAPNHGDLLNAHAVIIPRSSSNLRRIEAFFSVSIPSGETNDRRAITEELTAPGSLPRASGRDKRCSLRVAVRSDSLCRSETNQRIRSASTGLGITEMAGGATSRDQPGVVLGKMPAVIPTIGSLRIPMMSITHSDAMSITGGA